jgi:hypothetical protein
MADGAHFIGLLIVALIIIDSPWQSCLWWFVLLVTNASCTSLIGVPALQGDQNANINTTHN